MRIAVCLKQVPDSGTVTLDPETHTLVRGSVGVIINPLDEFPLEIAIRLKEASKGQLTAITMGPPRAEEVLARAIAMGADDGILLSDAKFAGGDTWATSLVLASAIKKFGPFDLVLCGKQAIDGDTAQVGPEIAAHLDWPQATGVCCVEMPAGNGEKKLRMTRLFEEGTDEISLPLPAVIMALKEAAEPRFGTLDGRIEYYKKGVRKVPSSELGIPLDQIGLKGSPTRVVKTAVPTVNRKRQKLSGSPGEQAQQLADILVSKKTKD
ncbi:MAG: hypothetical protein A2X49_02455 [Lentisphaerae bacterium GWF2_52_8]|nr:MAG: hypothetical protein A2X49_02455 [Lentisphaerae bacterium GWF2_52_8]